MHVSTGGRKRRAALVASATLGMIVAFVAPATSGTAATAPTIVTVPVVPRQVYTDTKLVLAPGDAVTINATGNIRFGGGRIAHTSPVGIPWGTACAQIAKGQARTTPWPAPGLSCWSLIAKIGAGPPFEIGIRRAFRAGAPGQLFVGVNDNYVADNSGSWQANIAVTRAAGSGAPGVSTGTSGKSSNTGLFVLIGLAVVAALILLVFFQRKAERRRRLDSVLDVGPAPLPPVVLRPTALPTARPEPIEAVMLTEPDPVVAAPAPEPLLVATVSAPPEASSIDVNIFEVEFSNGLTLRVGYNHFPEGTTVQWRVTQNRALAATGYFVTKGGGSTRNLETFPLGVKLDGRQAQPDGADVQFDWNVNGVPFRYSVRRDPNC